MKQLSTIQKREKLNDVFAVDEIGPGGLITYIVCTRLEQQRLKMMIHR